MGKLFFKYGTVGSAKTLNLLAVAHNYRQQGKKVVLVKPIIDIRFNREVIKSRAGLECPADILVGIDTNLLQRNWEGVDCILVDEVQFLSARIIEQLREISILHSLVVICYGLRTDFKSRLFEGSLRLLEMADAIEEIKNTCHYCTKKATMNLKHVAGKATLEGPKVELGAEERYFPVCYRCYSAQIKQAHLEDKELLKSLKESIPAL